MAKAAKKQTEKAFDVLNWYRGARATEICPQCGHPAHAHQHDNPSGDAGAHSTIDCPALPPAKTVDGAVITKPFVQQLEDATGVTAAKQLEAKAAANFAMPVPTDEQARELIDVTAIQPMARNPRGPLVGDITELKDSLDVSGLIVPILVRVLQEGKRYEIVSGHRRYAAAVALGWNEVLCDVRIMSEMQALELNLTEQLQRAQLTPLQEAKSCHELQELSGYNTKQIGARLGQSESWAAKRLALHLVDPAVKKALTDKRISLTVAVAIAALPTPAQQFAALEVGVPKGYETMARTAARITEEIQQDVCRPLKGSPFDQRDASLVAAAGACTTCPFNSANNRMPGLFDNAKAAATCAKPSCFDEKVNATWDAKTAKYAAEGAAVMTLAEGEKLYRHGNTLTSGSRYVEADTMAAVDPSKHSWAQLVKTLHESRQPQLHVARSPDGKLHELYVADKVVQALAKEGTKWAVKLVKRETTAEGKKQAAQKAEKKLDPAKQLEADQKRKAEEALQEARQEVQDQFSAFVAKKLEKEGPDLPSARMIARSAYNVDRYIKALGEKRPKDWVKNATTNQLLALTWWDGLSEDWFFTSKGFDQNIIDLAKRHGFDIEAAVQAQLGAAAAEAAKKPKKGKKA